jgi:hypothetical protein
MRLPRARALAAPLLAALMLSPAARAEPYTGTLYATEQLAQTACEGSAVVWVDPTTGRFAVKGNGWYGIGRNDAYACRDVVEPDPFAAKPAAPAVTPGIGAPIAPIQAIEPGYPAPATAGETAIPSGPPVPGTTPAPALPSPAPGVHGAND